MTQHSPAQIVISYCRRDSAWLQRLQVHLKPLARRGAIDLWDDSRISPGTEWRREIEAAFARANIAVLLISADFLASDFVTESELAPLLIAAESGGVLVVPVIVGPSLFLQHEALAKYQAANAPSRPLSMMLPHEAEDTLAQIAHFVAEKSEAARRAPGSSTPKPSDAVTGRRQRVLALVKALQARTATVTSCIVDSLALSLELQDDDLRAFCEREMSGYYNKGPSVAVNKDLSNEHRLVDFYVSLGVAVDIDYFGSGRRAIEWMEQHPKEFQRIKFLYPTPITELERDASSGTGSGLLASQLPASALVPDTDIPHVTVMCYADARDLVRVLDRIRTALTSKLLRHTGSAT